MGAVNLGQVAAFIDSVSVEPLAQGEAPYVRNDGTTSNAEFVFGLPTDSGAAAAQARAAANDSRADALKSEGYALGKQGGTEVTDTSPYWHNNSKYFSGLSSDYATAAAAAEERTRSLLSTKQDVLTFDTEPTAGSSNPVTSGGVFTAISNLGGYKVVPSLQSVTDPDEKTIYLVKDSTATGDDKYNEYIWQVDQGVGSWQQIGTTSLDLSGYIKNTDLATANTAGIVKPDGSTITVDANGVISGASLITFDQDDFDETQGEVSLAPQQRIFTGTTPEWNALTSAQKAKYEIVHLTDDASLAAPTAPIPAASTTIAGPTLSPNTALMFMFTQNIDGTDTTTPLAITYNGTSIPVKAHSGGNLVSVTAKEISSGTYRYCDAYTSIQVVYDGTNFVIVGNPVVLSSSDYTIYADGQKACRQVGAQYTSPSITTYSTSWTTGNFVFNDVPKGKYQVGWVLTPGVNFNGSMNVLGKISLSLSSGYGGGLYQTTEVVDVANGGQYTYSGEISVSDMNGAIFACVLTRIA